MKKLTVFSPISTLIKNGQLNWQIIPQLPVKTVNTLSKPINNRSTLLNFSTVFTTYMMMKKVI
ncbi:hypothetical protein CMT37_05060 [Elizabethkingia anophelis]|nr:hypothetical protein [Elizabethkingia anophelis]